MLKKGVSEKMVVKMKGFQVLFLLFSLALVVFSRVDYDGYKVFKLVTKTRQQAETVSKLDGKRGFNFWRGPGRTSSDVMISPIESTNLTFLTTMGIEVEEMIQNVGTLIKNEKVNRQDGVKLNWKEYSTLTTMYNFLYDMAETHKDQAEIFNIGKSFEGRDILGIKISSSINETLKKPTIFIDANIHAREWITSAVATYFINDLLNSPQSKQLIDEFEWHIVPVLNVDGFTYSHDVDRMWRKTRSKFTASRCFGTDPNRNFDFAWMSGNGASPDPCAETYGGKMAFSEPETIAVKEYIEKLARETNLVFYLSLHSYSQLILFPWGYTTHEISQYDTYIEVVREAARMHQIKHYTIFEGGSTAALLYEASGSSMDWAYGKVGVPLCLTYEFRDKGRHGFVLPASEIIPSSQEFIMGIPVYTQALKNGKFGKLME